jgi:hypothetical protein
MRSFAMSQNQNESQRPGGRFRANSHWLSNRLTRDADFAWNRARELLRELAPKIFFFFSVFMLMFLIFKLFIAQYSIEFSAFTKAAVAALIVGKIISLLDWAQSGYRFDRYPRALVIAGKTVIYGLAVIIFGTGDRILKAFLKQGSIRAGVNLMIAHANMDRFLGLVLLICLVVGASLIIQEISRAMGSGALFRLFFEAPDKHPAIFELRDRSY